MEIIREMDNYTAADKKVFLALGNFDGVHLGHRKLLGEAVSAAKLNQGIAAAFIFDPHPNNIIKPDKVPKLITKSDRQAELLKQIGINLLVYNSFTEEISKWKPEEFVQKVIVDKFKASKVFVGFNYSFGYKGKGNSETLADLGRKYGFEVKVIPPVEINGSAVSSTSIREMVEMGNIKEAQVLLGHFPVVEGIVIRGDQRGTKIGFPTANLQVDSDVLIPGTGVYAAKVLHKGVFFNCVVNVGIKPTFHINHPVTVEAHIIDFFDNIYDEYLRIYFLEKVRDEKKFENIDDLVKQISKDKDIASQIAIASSI
ncbi:MAG TPA: bifunctional riboflavin kinase/FAD synthetase [Syntrophomonadaceae bacterium]|nr:bifunctional riboflavin kinase/FAD synthetase [Syntrophomonadaceae bacterium]